MIQIYFCIVLLIYITKLTPFSSINVTVQFFAYCCRESIYRTKRRLMMIGEVGMPASDFNDFRK